MSTPINLFLKLFLGRLARKLRRVLTLRSFFEIFFGRLAWKLRRRLTVARSGGGGGALGAAMCNFRLTRAGP
jgi:hypothetical protein